MGVRWLDISGDCSDWVNVNVSVSVSECVWSRVRVCIVLKNTVELSQQDCLPGPSAIALPDIDLFRHPCTQHLSYWQKNSRGKRHILPLTIVTLFQLKVSKTGRMGMKHTIT